MHGRGNNKDKKDETLLKVRIQAGACQLHGCWGIKVGRRAGAIRSCLRPPELIQGWEYENRGKNIHAQSFLALGSLYVLFGFCKYCPGTAVVWVSAGVEVGAQLLEILPIFWHLW